MAATTYLTVTQLFEAAFDKMGLGRVSDWPILGSRTNWVNDAILETQRLTGYYIRCERRQFVSPWRMVDLGSSELELVKLVEAWTVAGGDFSVSDLPLGIQDMNAVRSFRGRTGAVAITAFADYGGTVQGTVRATCTGHGLTDKDQIWIDRTTNYNGRYIIHRIDANNFYFTATWAATETGRWSFVERPVLALNLYPYRTPYALGSATVEAYPAFTQNTTVELVWEDAPPLVEAAADTVRLPADAISAHLAHFIALAKAPDKAAHYRALYEAKCQEIRTRLLATRRAEVGTAGTTFERPGGE